MAEERQPNVYYNSQFFKPNTSAEYLAEFLEADFFPPDWQRIVWDRRRKTLRKQSRQVAHQPTHDLFA